MSPRSSPAGPHRRATLGRMDTTRALYLAADLVGAVPSLLLCGVLLLCALLPVALRWGDRRQEPPRHDPFDALRCAHAGCGRPAVVRVWFGRPSCGHREHLSPVCARHFATGGEDEKPSTCTTCGEVSRVRMLVGR